MDVKSRMCAEKEIRLSDSDPQKENRAVLTRCPDDRTGGSEKDREKGPDHFLFL